ncbi:MAG: hypothetical protein PWQ41_1046 [Bacillota bacterium]|nr:hypothetical protein [Bacillota bacterium]
MGGALRWGWAAFEFMALGKVSKKLGIWQEVRARALELLEEKNEVQLLIEIALHEGDVGRALELLPRVSGYLQNVYWGKAAEAAEEKGPINAAGLYRQLAEAAIGERQRKAYRQAVEYLRRMKVVLDRVGKRREWEEYLTGLKKRYARYPALLDELQKAKL